MTEKSSMDDVTHKLSLGSSTKFIICWHLFLFLEAKNHEQIKMCSSFLSLQFIEQYADKLTSVFIALYCFRNLVDSDQHWNLTLEHPKD